MLEESIIAVLWENLPGFVGTLRSDLAAKGTVRANLEEIVHAAMNFYEKLLPQRVNVNEILIRPTGQAR